MSSSPVHLPYFDRILERLSAGDADVQQAFGQHVHWGYWETPQSADGTVADFSAAAGRLSERLLTHANLRNGQRILDVGCGFGGTLALLNQRLSDAELVGLNIDPRQLAQIQNNLIATSGNQIELVAGDACQLPFAAASFDTVVCVEAIFHFGSRRQFFAEVQRVLRPGGVFVLSDFVPRFVIPFLWDYFERRTKPLVTQLYGPSDMRCTLSDYRRLAESAGLELVVCDDVTRNTMPTYRVLRPLVRRIANDPDRAEEVIRRVEFTTRIGLLRYLILAFRKR